MVQTLTENDFSREILSKLIRLEKILDLRYCYPEEKDLLL
jgi:hypothetical protein